MFWPDQFFSSNLIKNSLRVLNQGADLIIMPSLDVEENKVKNTSNLLNNLNLKNVKSYKLQNLNKYYSNYIEIDSLSENFLPRIVGRIGNPTQQIIIKNFHCIPLVFKTSNNYGAFIKPIYPSLDEGLSEYFVHKKVFYPNSHKFGILVEL